MLKALFGDKRNNIMKDLPWHEIKDEIMHNRDGSYVTGFFVDLPQTVFVPDFVYLVTLLRGGLQSDLQERMQLRFMLEAGPANRDILKRVRKRITAPERGLRYLLEKRADMLEQDWERGSVIGWRAYVLVRVNTKAKKFYTLTEAAAKERKERAHQVRSDLMQAFTAAGYKASTMGDQDIFRLVHRYMNPGQWHYDQADYKPTWQRYATKSVEQVEGNRPPTLRAQLAESTIDNKRAGHLIVDDHYVRMMTMNKQPDQQTFVTMMQDAFKGGEKFFVVIDLYHQPYEHGATVTRARARRFKAAAEQTDTAVDAETKMMAEETAGLADHMVRQGDHQFLVSVGFILYDTNLKHLNNRIEKLHKAMQRVPGRPFRILAQGLFTPFLDFAPFSGRSYSERVSLTTTNVVHLFPVDGEWRGAKKPIAYFRNRYWGVSGLDAFEGTNFNSLIVGKSGSGKTFFMNYTLSEFLGDADTQVVIIDRGSGYLPLVKVAEGVTIPLRPGGGTRINPFDILPGQNAPSDMEKQNLLKVIRAMIPGQDGSDYEIENNILMAAIDQLYRGAVHYDRETEQSVFRTPTMTDLYKKLTILTEVGQVRASDKVREIAYNLALRLQAWTGNTPLGKFVDGPTNVPLSQARTVYYDTDGIASDKQLKVVGVLLIANLVWRRVSQTLGQNTLVVLDEGWSMLQESLEARSFVDEMYRRFRRYGAGIWSVSQSYDDFKGLPGITNNAEMFFGLRVDEEERRIWREAMKLPKRTMEHCASVHQKPGEYSEAMCMFKRETGWEGDIIAVHPTPQDYFCFTTKDAEMALREKQLEANGGDWIATLEGMGHDDLATAA